MNNTAENIRQIYHQVPENVLIMAVSKGQTCDAVAAAAQAGIQNFGENYIQEAIHKIQNLHAHPFIWHYIGRIQSNKCHKISEYFHWVHTIDSLKIAEKLNHYNQQLQHIQNICIQINLFGESQKGGISPALLETMIPKIIQLPYLKLRGFMTILPLKLSPPQQLAAYQDLAQLKNQINLKYHLDLDTLSMGMSADYPLAIQAGSTCIRLGQAIFGPRT